jgi:hypothetical protein
MIRIDTCYQLYMDFLLDGFKLCMDKGRKIARYDYYGCVHTWYYAQSLGCEADEFMLKYGVWNA